MTRTRKGKERPVSPDDITFPFQKVIIDEIEGAVTMFVLRQNFVATHLLNHAAHQMMRAYSKAKKIPLQADLHAIIREVIPDIAKDAIDGFLHAYNGLKHFQSENEGNVTINPTLMKFEIWLCIGDYMALFGKPTETMAVYHHWYMAMKIAEAGHAPPERNMFPSAAINAPLGQTLKEAKAILAAIEERSITNLT